MGISPFSDREYLTFVFHEEGEEHLVPSSLFAKSHTIRDLANYENHIVLDIASHKVSNLTDYLNGDKKSLTPEKIKGMIVAAEKLGLRDTVIELLTKLT